MINWRIPYLTTALPGIGGVLRQALEDFIVEEIPAYAPSGEGEHTFFAIEKRGVPTMAIVREIAHLLDVQERDIGTAGWKDARAIAQQTLSVLHVPPERIMALELSQAHVLWAKRHTNKLRTGHLRGNRFTIRIRDVHPDAAARSRPILETLKQRGVPNGYGRQRFGNHGDNADIGLLLLREDYAELRERDLYRHMPPKLSYRMRRFYISAFQSALFNQYLTARIQQGTMDDVLLGDIAKKENTGGLFHVEDVETDRQRVRDWEISPTGPIYGYKLWSAKQEAGALEQAILQATGITRARAMFRAAKMKGTRRPLRYAPMDLYWRIEDKDLILKFFAPKGSYATMLLRELMKP
jgi:tRNA pseudouridine13 synthase